MNTSLLFPRVLGREHHFQQQDLKLSPSTNTALIGPAIRGEKDAPRPAGDVPGNERTNDSKLGTFSEVSSRHP